MGQEARTVVVGLGNPVLADDSVGIQVARAVRARLGRQAGSTVEVVELYAGGIRLLETITGYQRAVIIDAMVTGQLPPGTIRRLPLEGLSPARNTLSVHDMDLLTALELGRVLQVPLPAEIRLWGIEARDVETFSEELSPELSRSLPRAVEKVLADCRGTCE